MTETSRRFHASNANSMKSLSINLLRWNSGWDEIRACIEAVLASDLVDFELTYMENFNPDCPSLASEVKEQFGADGRVRVVVTEANLGYAGGHNRFFEETGSELLMVLNPDARIEPDFLKKIVAAFEDPHVGAATGKMIKPGQNRSGERTLDGTGILVSRSRRGYERGQLEIDRGQYDKEPQVFGVSGTAAVYRKSALEAVKIGTSEYFDEDFFAYWEDLDLSWRLRLRGFSCVYVPGAIVEHQRAVGKSEGGIRNFFEYVRHHRAFPLNVRQWSWRNHLFAILKNDHGWRFFRDLPFIAARELGMLIFLLCFMPDTLLAVPGALRLLPKMLAKRRYIMRHIKPDVGMIDPFSTLLAAPHDAQLGRRGR